jgi:lysyl endopeptidase
MAGNPGNFPLAGDWNSDGIDTIGLFYNGIFYLRNANTTGSADLTIAFGLPTDLPGQATGMECHPPRLPRQGALR